MMTPIRQALVQATVWLTAATTLVAGMPYPWCRCAPVGAIAKSTASKCCCCVEPQDEDDADPDAPPCCPTAAPRADDSSEDGATPALRQRGCVKKTNEPPTPAVVRVDASDLPMAALTLAINEVADCGTSKSSAGAVVASLPLPPPLDVQLLFQHFLL